MDSDKKESGSAFSFVDAENNVLKFWEKQDIFQKTLKKTENNQAYVFYDGPPFATGLPHHGHLVASTIKDVVPRYFTMKGYYIQRRFGWDCHGLPIEHEIDKSLGMSAQETVAKIGIAGYNNECRKIVQRYTSEWEKTITRIGRWVDFKNDYRTMEPWYMESVWWVFQQIWNKGLVYKGEKVVAFSTELSTVLSNFEAGSNYKDVQDPAVTVLFKLADEDAYISAWTTTPWTLPSNLALCVGPEIEYVKVNDEERDLHLWVANARVEAVLKGKKYSIVDSCKGRDLVGRRYEPLFGYFSYYQQDGAFTIIADEYVSVSSGSGIVHMAPAFGEDDHRITRAHGIFAMPCPIDDCGRFTSEVPDFAGVYVKDADKLIMKQLSQRGILYKQETIVHSYPFCPRSDTPIIYRAIPSWYIKVEQMRDELIANNQQINWVPEHLRDGRMGKWLENALDWAVSRNRYWGTPLPIWINDVTGKALCIGSRAELQQYSGVLVDDLHRDNVDSIVFSIAGEEGVYRRIDEVFDCWFESGSMPYAQVNYPFENKSDFLKSFPAEFIAEGLDQTRGWFYTLQIISNCLFNKPAFKNVIVNGIVNAEDGKKMSKRLKNYTAPDIIMETHGADALRLYLINSGLVRAEEQSFAHAGVQEMVRRMLLPWLNAFNFLKTYCEIDNWKMGQQVVGVENVLDRWIISRLQSLKSKISVEMESYHLYNVVPPLFEYMEELTNWYIRLNRSRFWGDGVSQDKLSAYQTLFTCLDEFGQIMAPFAPFFAEHLYQAMRPLRISDSVLESVHLCDYPVSQPELIVQALEHSVERLQNIVLLGRQKRNQANVKMKTPLRLLRVLHKDQVILNDIALLEQYIKSELNVKGVEYNRNEGDYVEFYAKPNFPVLGKKLGKDFKQYKTLIEQLSEEQLTILQDNGEITLNNIRFDTNDIQLYRQAKPGTNAISNSRISIDLDCSLDESLTGEGMVREVISRIQKTRKELNLKVEKRIDIRCYASDKLSSWLEQHQNYVKNETLALHFNLKPRQDLDADTEALHFIIDEHELIISLTPVS
ncbi:isoleucine--tRNA ligase [Xenorhabdus bovienii]|uniref:isoleucine--tRNA ligase n=1 Tax=Xenorhabdus bovienii TaxID=40576 RepID=UPI0023B33ED3|nr:isoleucine--tRNA ligase [Xenorhabdus bovienii]MDE9482438.1 isoleucine--tRNA ligase [Xenorhabdus bovienii]